MKEFIAIASLILATAAAGYGEGQGASADPGAQTQETIHHRTLRLQKEALEEKLAPLRKEEDQLDKLYEENAQQMQRKVTLANARKGLELAQDRGLVSKYILPISNDIYKTTMRMLRVDECDQVFAQTIDMKQSDLTTRQTGLISACKALELYPFSERGAK